MGLENDLLKEWKKISDYNIFRDIKEFEAIFEKKPKGKCYKKYNHLGWCKENFFFGTYQELLEYYKTTTEIPYYLKDYIGKKYANLTIIEFYRDEKNTIFAKCQCDCGNYINKKWQNIVDGKVRTCGCAKRDAKIKNSVSFLEQNKDCEADSKIHDGADNELNAKLLEEWKKIKGFNIFGCFEEFKNIFNQNPKGKCYKKYNHLEWCKENFFFGTYQELLEYYKTTTEIPYYLKDYIGKKYAYLTIKDFYRDENNIIFARCQCDCGNYTNKKWQSIVDMKVRTCGCVQGNGKVRGEDKTSLKDMFPKLVDKYWDYELNIENPEEIDSESDVEYYWKGYTGSFLMSPKYLHGTKKGTSFPEQSICYYFKKLGFNMSNRKKISYDGKKYEVDVFFDDYNIAIEYDGYVWHENKLEEDIYKNKIMENSEIYFIRVRETGLLNTNMNYGIEIFVDPTNKNYIVEMINSLINIISTKISKKIDFILSEREFLLDKGKIHGEYLNSFDENSLQLSWLMKHWSEKNEVKAYSVDINSYDKYIFKCANGLDAIYESPSYISWVAKNCKHRQTETEKYCIREKLTLQIAGPCLFTRNCPANKYIHVDDYIECRYCHIKSFEDTRNDLFESLIAFGKKKSDEWSSEDSALYVNFSAILRYQTQKVDDVLVEFLESSSASKDKKWKFIHNYFSGYSLTPLKYDILLNYYFDNYDFSSLNKNVYSIPLSKNNINLDPNHEERINFVFKGVISSKQWDILEKLCIMTKERMSAQAYDNFLFNLFLKIYSTEKYYKKLNDKIDSLSKFVNIISKYLSASYREKLLELSHYNSDQLIQLINSL